jgi:serine/threonine protein kinase
LVQGDQVYITDFGIAKYMDVNDTTGSADSFLAGTRTYCSPEAKNGDRRGRTSDIFSLGCCFLEIATVMIAAGELGNLRTHRGGPFEENPNAILRWIYYLLSILAARARAARRPSPARDMGSAPEDLVLQYGALLPGLVFVMMDPNPETRTTARQLVALISAWEKDLFCPGCRLGLGEEDPNIPLHSKFKRGKDLVYPTNPLEALEANVAEDWEAAKKLWLRFHIWW